MASSKAAPTVDIKLLQMKACLLKAKRGVKHLSNGGAGHLVLGVRYAALPPLMS